MEPADRRRSASDLRTQIRGRALRTNEFDQPTEPEADHRPRRGSEPAAQLVGAMGGVRMIGGSWRLQHEVAEPNWLQKLDLPAEIVRQDRRGSGRLGNNCLAGAPTG